MTFVCSLDTLSGPQRHNSLFVHIHGKSNFNAISDAEYYYTIGLSDTGTSTSRFPDTSPDITTTPRTTTTTTATTTTIKTTLRPEVTSWTTPGPEVPSEEDTLDFDLNTTDFRQGKNIVCGQT